MSLKIDQDHSRFRNIVRGKIRQNLRRYISQGEMLGRKGKDLVSIPIPQIDIPRFTFGDKQKGGVGQGKGDSGDPVGGEQAEGEDGAGQAGKDAGDHVLEVDITLDELADKLAAVGTVTRNRYLVRAAIEPYQLTIFPDGRAVIGGTEDVAEARSVYAKYVGN